MNSICVQWSYQNDVLFSTVITKVWPGFKCWVASATQFMTWSIVTIMYYKVSEERQYYTQ